MQTPPRKIFSWYQHHGKQVAAFSDLVGLHRDFCLCYSCGKFNPGQENNCPIAQELYEFCVKHGATTPMWECPEFEV